MQPEVTVIVCTYNRADDLEALLDTVCNQETDGFSYEVLVVDNNSTDMTLTTVEKVGRRSSQAPQYLFEPRQGKSFALNTGLREAQGKLVAIIDDDQLMPQGYISQIVQCFREYPEVAFIGGKVLPLWEQEPPKWLTARQWAPIGMSDYGEEEFIVNADRPVCLLTCTFRRNVLKEVGGFRQDLGVTGTNGIGSTEDAEIQQRIWKTGHPGLYVPDLVLHHRTPKRRLTRKYFLRWHRGHGGFRARYREESAERSRARFLDVPAHMYRQAVQDLLRYLYHMALMNQDAAFEYLTRLYFFQGFFWYRCASLFSPGVQQVQPGQTQREQENG